MTEETHYTDEADRGFVDASRPDAVTEARRKHRLATADPEPERDGTMTGPAHEEKYGLERAEESAAQWRGIGVHPTENRALVEGEDGAENLHGAPVTVTDEDADAEKAAPAKTSAKSAPKN